MSATTRVYVARLAGTTVFDPLGDEVGKVRDVVVIVRPKGAPRAVGLVVEVPGRRRVFLPLTRVTSMDGGQVISTGLLNMRRFEQRALETLAVGELLERMVTLADGTGTATVLDLAITKQRTGDWLVDKVFVRRQATHKGPLGIRRRGETLTLAITEISGLARTSGDQGAAMLLAAYDDMKAADLADVLHDLADRRRFEVAQALDNERLADVLEELPEDDQVSILSNLDTERAADVLEAMQPDDAADLLHELSESQAAELLERMEPEDARDVRRLLAYDEDSAGGLMTTEPVILSPETSIAAALASIRRKDLPAALATMVFVTRPPLETPTGRFLGVVHFQRLLREPPHEAVGTVLDTDVEGVPESASVERVTRELATYDMLSVPVLDAERRLVGAVSVDDVLDHVLPDDWRETDDEHDDGGSDRDAGEVRTVPGRAQPFRAAFASGAAARDAARRDGRPARGARRGSGGDGRG
ncbi:magnesium transporter MgtE N-terminal domain-containing protein [Cellulomonas sp. PhB143]|uniref:magnesium transporter MgtE N-terminal domain-containing protein n=1 Tax=Cellulomonas sp. PhB143 TaxID=2485186 RepID=UPI000F4AD959|nr:CBS domain-containing protein [Cellulomonas sp. PhB143]ROS76848.1 Mg/Co/Ni transporter MgtE [Cellulomonas sp. PhB143]